MSETDGNRDKRGRDEPDEPDVLSQLTESQNSQIEESQIEESQARKRARPSELNRALVVFATELALVNDEKERAQPVESQMDGASDESVTPTIRSGSSASTDNTIDSNASNASTEIEAFFAPPLPAIAFEQVGSLFTNLASSFNSAAERVKSNVVPIAMSAATQALTLPEPVRNQLTELSIAVTMLGLSRYMPNINAYMTTRQNNMINAGVNALLTSVSGIQSSLNSWLLRGGVGITLAVALLRSNIAPSAITRFFTELSVTRAAVYDIMFTFSRSADDLKLGQNQYDRLKGEYQSAMEALIAAIGNKLPAGDIARLEPVSYTHLTLPTKRIV